MPELRIVNVPKELISNINMLFEKSEYSDRSSFLVAVLKDYCLYHDEYFIHCLPNTVKILAEDYIRKEAKNKENLLQLSLAAIHKSNKLLKQFCDILNLENEENEEGEGDF